jgi:hypothetical protein
MAVLWRRVRSSTLGMEPFLLVCRITFKTMDPPKNCVSARSPHSWSFPILFKHNIC